MNGPLPVWRSLLYVPVNVEKYVEKAHTRGADAIQLDLEDSVPAAEKENARTLVRAAATRVRRGGSDVVVRINRPIRAAIRDIEASVWPEVNALAVTKIESAGHVRILSEAVASLERERGMEVGTVRFLALVETAQAFFHMEEIARADPRIVALTLGSEDFAFALGAEPTADSLFFAKAQSVIAARAAGVIPLGYVGTVAGYGDLEGFRAIVRRARGLGFEGGSAIHPAQVAILNEEFSPPADEVARASRMVEADREAERGGRGSFGMDGKMIDIPVVLRAQRLLQRHDAIVARTKRAS
ncbi:MAG: CoA ester lyase [Rhodospirillales bacterium]|nr:CoA ester lyase [Rhodospirillales bacterium]